MSARAVVFIGPSSPARALEHPELELLPPVARGDVFRLLDRDARPPVIAIIDGYFQHAPTVLHKELLAALDCGITVLGGASMGALRAAELARYGMQGIGEIYQCYVSGEITGDDEVALVHGSPEQGYRPLSVPLIELRLTLERARARDEIDEASAHALLEHARTLPFFARNLAELVRPFGPEASRELLARLRAGWVAQKRIDADAVLARAVELVARERTPLAVDRAPRPLTTLVAHHRANVRDPGGWGVSDLELLAVARLLVPGARTALRDAIVELLLADIAERAGLEPHPIELLPGATPDELRQRGLTREDMAAAERRAGLIAALEAWWAESRPQASAAALRRAALCLRRRDPSEDSLAALPSFDLERAGPPLDPLVCLRTPEGCLPDTALVVALKLGEYGRMAYELGAQAQKLNEMRRHDDPRFEPALLAAEWLLARFRQRHGLDHAGLSRFVTHCGFADLEAFAHALRLTFLLRQRQPPLLVHPTSRP